MIAKDLAKVINDTIKETGDEWLKVNVRKPKCVPKSNAS